MSRGIRQAVFFYALFLTLTGLLTAQTNFGRISGTITDPSGAVIPGVKVTIVNAGTKAARNLTTDDHGFYVAENLPIGPYTVSVEQTGFKRAGQTGLNLVADGRLTADFMLQLGDSAQSVEVVDAAAATLNTVSGEVSHVVDQKQVDELPLNGRAYMELLTLVPGAVVTNPDQFGVLTTLSATNQVVNGHRSNQNNMTVDGVGNLDAGSNGSLINNVSPDAIQEVKIQTSNFSAEYGRSTGAAFNIVTKGGTNSYHGTLFENFRNDLLDARNFFSVSRNALRYNDFGYRLSGPIKKDKLWFSVLQEWRRLKQQSAGVRASLPTTAQLSGNFSNLLPTATAKGTILTDPTNKTPFPGNIIPVTRITPDGYAIINVFDTVTPMAARFTNAPGSNNATYQLPTSLDYREDYGRIDYRLSDKHNLFGRWIDDFNTVYLPYGPSSTTGSYLPLTPENRDRPGKSFLVSETWVASPNLINEAHIGTSWNSQHYWNQGTTWQRGTQGFTFQRVYNSVGPYTNGVPDVNIQNFTQWQGPSHTLISPTTNIELADTVSIVKGQHTIRTGALVMRNRKDQNGRSNYDGAVTFNTSGGNPLTTGYALADALLGNFQTYTEAAYDPMGHYRYTEPSVFVDDNWRINRRLSLNLGLRYEYMMAMYSAADNLSEFLPSLYNPAQAVKVDPSGNGLVPGSGNIYNGLVRVGTGVNPGLAYLVPNANDPSVLTVPAGAPRGMYPSQGTWAPRVGFAFAVDANTVLRGGFGLFYDRIQGNPTFYTLNNPPYVGTVEYQYSNLVNIKGGSTVNAPWGTIQTIDPNLKIPRSQQFSLGIQRQLPLKLFADVTYVGTLGRHLLDEPDINQPSWAVLGSVAKTTPVNTIRPYIGYSTIQQFESRAISNYNSLQLHLTRRAGNVLFFTAAYTFSKDLGDSSSDTGNYKDIYNIANYYGPLTFDARHTFVGTVVWTLPQLKAKSAFLRAPLGGWRLSTVLHLQSGFHDTIVGDSAIVTGRVVDYIGGSVLLPNPGPNGWFNPAAFALAPQNRWGNEGVGIAVGPGMQIYNLSLAKTFAVRERMRLLFQADFFNAFNCVNFNQPSGNSSSSGIGTITAAYPPREIQFGAKLTF